MRILHIADLHFKNDTRNIYQLQKNIENMLIDIETNIHEKIDMICFTGDLVFSGTNKEDFTKAQNLLFDKLKDSIKIDESMIFCCPGNHDVDRSISQDLINNYFENKIDGISSLEKLIAQDTNPECLLSYKALENYFEFSSKFYKSHIERYKDNIQKLFTSHQREIEGKKIGVITMNTAWRSQSDNDIGNLYFPVSAIEKAIMEIKDTDLKIVLLHHPLAYIKEFNKYKLEDVIFDKFHFIFSGHLHEFKLSKHFTTGEGIFNFVTPATLAKTETGKTGYSLLNIDPNDFSVTIQIRLFDVSSNVYYEALKTTEEFPFAEEKKRLNNFRKKTKKLFFKELDIANDLLISTDEDNGKNFLTLFNNPILKTKSIAEIMYSQKDENTYPIDKLINTDQNYIIYAREKSGKTSLLKKIMLEQLNEYAVYNILPLYIDLSENKKHGEINLLKHLASEYEQSQSSMEKFLLNTRLVVLIDNYNPFEFNKFTNLFIKYLQSNPNTNFIICTEESLIQNISSLTFGTNNFVKLFIHSVLKSDVRSLTFKTLEVSDEEKDEIVSKIIEVFETFKIPFNYWMVSIFLWIYKKNNRVDIYNNSDLIELYIQELLDRNYLANKLNNRFAFDNYKHFLAKLAYTLLCNHRELNYAVDYAELVNFTQIYIKSNDRIVATPEDILSYVTEKKILKKNSDGFYTFRLNCVFEIFLAYYLTYDEEFKDKILNDNRFYLSFQHELELYSGFVKYDKEFLERIFKITQEAFRPVNEKYSTLGSHDNNLVSKIVFIQDLFEPHDFDKKKPLTKEQQYKIIDTYGLTEYEQVEVTLKKESDPTIINFVTLEKHIYMLSRIFRNMDLIEENRDFLSEVFDFIIDSFCNLGFHLIDELDELYKNFLKQIEEEHEILHTSKKSDKEIENAKVWTEDLINRLMNLTPVLMEVFVSDGLGHVNMERIITNRINELKKESVTNQYKLFLLYFLLMDIDPNNIHKYLDEVIDIFKINILKSSVFLKIIYYYMYKSDNKDKLIEFLRSKIIIQQKNLNPKSDITSLFSDLDKRKLIKRLQDK